MRPTIVISQILQDLKDGYTRTTTSPGYDPEIGSIQEKYNLNKTQVLQLFKHPQLLKKRTIIKKDLGFIIEDDVTPSVNVESNTSTSVETAELTEYFDENDTNNPSEPEVAEIPEIESISEEPLEDRGNPFQFD